MIYQDGTNSKIEETKRIFKITGDVYVVGAGNYMESLESHKRLFPQSTATTIEEAEKERIALIAAEKEVRTQVDRTEAVDIEDANDYN